MKKFTFELVQGAHTINGKRYVTGETFSCAYDIRGRFKDGDNRFKLVSKEDVPICHVENQTEKNESEKVESVPVEEEKSSTKSSTTKKTETTSKSSTRGRPKGSRNKSTSE